MKEGNIPENTQQTTTQAGDKRVLKRLLKAMLWIAGIWLALLIILQVALSPAVLTKVVDKLAPQYIDGDLSFSRIKISMFRYFPNVGITLEDGALTYQAERDRLIDTLGAREVFIDTGKETCLDRLLACEDNRDKAEWERYINDWWLQYQGGY